VKRRVVVIDDDADVRELIGKVLVRAGHEVLAASTGEAGLALFDLHEVHCAVVDKLLPQMNGLEVLAAVRTRFPKVPVVLVTAHPEPFNLEAERPDVVLAKPFKNLKAIEDAVKEALDGVVVEKSALTNLKERVVAVVRRKRE
jgi:CheY-like chemotaxis protein